MTELQELRIFSSEAIAIIQRLIHPMADEQDIEDAKKLLEKYA